MDRRRSSGPWVIGAAISFMLSFVALALLIVLPVRLLPPPHQTGLVFTGTVGFLILSGILLSVSALSGSFRPRKKKQNDRGRSNFNLPPGVFNLPYVPGNPEGSYAPERWSSEFRARVRAKLVVLNNRFVSLEEQCSVFKKISSTIWASHGQFEAEIESLLKYAAAWKCNFNDAIQAYDQGYPHRFEELFIIRGPVALRNGEYSLLKLKERYHTEPPADQTHISRIEHEFKTVYFNKTDNDRERLIKWLMKQKQCSREEAMTHAIEKLRYETRSWR